MSRGKRRVEARRWFQQAVYDLKAAQWNAQGQFFAHACFLAQQAAEKALKSLLYYLGKPREALLTHSLVELVRRARSDCPEVGDLLEEARLLDIHYVPARYPNGLPSGYPHTFYSKAMAEEALEAARKVLQSVQHFYRRMGEEDILRPEENGPEGN